MKKIISVFISVCLCLSVCSCSMVDLSDIDTDSFAEWESKVFSSTSESSEEITVKTEASQDTSSSEYTVDIEINCIENLIFSRYNVKIYVDDSLQGTLEHGKNDTYTIALKSGSHSIKFVDEEDDSVFGEFQISVSGNDTFKFEIYCTSLGIDVDELQKDIETVNNNEQTSSEEISTSGYKINLEIDCTENLMFSRYNVKIYVDNSLQGTLEHGKKDTYIITLSAGTHSIKFVNKDDDSVFGESQIEVSKDDTFKFEIYCTSLKINVDDLSGNVTNENYTEQATEPPSEFVSKYEKAFVKKANGYDVYYMFDMDEKTVVYFVTNDTSIMEGTYSGDFDFGVTMTWELVGDTWTEKFIHKNGSNTATWVDHLGLEYPEFTVCDVETAQKILDSLQN